MPRVDTLLGRPLDSIGTGVNKTRFWVTEGSIFVVQVGKSATTAVTDRYNEICQELVDAGRRIHLFNDWVDIETYEPETRQSLIRWAMANRNSLRRSFYYAHTKVLLMALHVSSLTFAKGLVATSSEQEFYDAFLAIRKKVRQGR